MDWLSQPNDERADRATNRVPGAIVAWNLTGTVQSFVYDVQPNDARAFAVAGVTLLAAALIASAIPARRAASVDPTIAWRAE